MSKVRVLVGTRKGAFILTSDGKREKWDVSGPHFAGWELYHLKGSPADPNRIYASQTSGWFGQIIQRSDDGGKTWHQPGTPPGEPAAPAGPPKGDSNKFAYDASPETGKPLTTHQWYDGTQHPWEFKRVWHLEPSLNDPDTVYAGVEDAALFRTTDGGKTWQELAGLRGHGTGPKWQPGAGGMCLHTILLDPSDPNRIYIAISAAGAFRTDDAGKSWRPINRGLSSKYLPDPNAEATLHVCTLRWDERTQSPHAERLVLIGGLLALRSQWLMPRLAAMRHGGRWRVDGDVLDVRWTLGDGSTWSLAANFGAAPAPLVRDGQTVFALRADETRLLGDGVHVGLEPPHA